MKSLLSMLFLALYLKAQSFEAPADSLQLLVVSVYDLKDTHAILRTYERSSPDSSWEKVFKGIPVSLGRSGLGLGDTNLDTIQEYPLKHEGDGRTPAGVFALSKIFGYAAKAPSSKMPYIQATKDLHCVDDNRSQYYNQIIKASSGYTSYEMMQREDNLYKWGIVVDYNTKREPNRGSCIFIHIQSADKKPTAGCTAMKEEDILKIIMWLDAKKHPVLMQYWSEQ